MGTTRLTVSTMHGAIKSMNVIVERDLLDFDRAYILRVENAEVVQGDDKRGSMSEMAHQRRPRMRLL